MGLRMNVWFFHSPVFSCSVCFSYEEGSNEPFLPEKRALAIMPPQSVSKTWYSFRTSPIHKNAPVHENRHPCKNDTPKPYATPLSGETLNCIKYRVLLSSDPSWRSTRRKAMRLCRAPGSSFPRVCSGTAPKTERNRRRRSMWAAMRPALPARW